MDNPQPNPPQTSTPGQISSNQNPPAGQSPLGGAPSVPPPKPTPPTPPPPPPPQPKPTPPPAPPTPPPPPPPAPPAGQSPLGGATPPDSNMGVGTPNIGVEKDDEAPKPTIDNFKPVDPPKPPEPEENKAEPGKVTHPTIDVSDYDDALKNPEPAEPATPPSPPHPATPPPAGQTPSGDSVGASPLGGATVNNYQDNPPANPPQPPVKAPKNTSLVIFILFALVLGSGAGFFGFKYWDSFKTSAFTEAAVSPTPEDTSTPSLDVATWQTYTSKLYNFSVKYPKGWKTSTTADSAETIVFASNAESLTAAPTGYKIEINFQDANDQTLKKWIEANNTVTGEKGTLKEIKVDSQTAYQQTSTLSAQKVTTYLERSGKIMLVTYSAPADKFSAGGEWYNNFINSIVLT